MPKTQANEVDVLIGLGSNVGVKQAHLTAGIARLAEFCEILDVSSLYRTSPVGYPDQDWFLNAAAKLRTALDPVELLSLAKTIELDHGRTHLIPNGPRTLDIDLLAASNSEGAIVSVKHAPLLPHPRMHQRRFVLEPLAEVACDWEHPRLERTVCKLLEELQTDESVERLSALDWPPKPTA